MVEVLTLVMNAVSRIIIHRPCRLVRLRHTLNTLDKSLHGGDGGDNISPTMFLLL